MTLIDSAHQILDAFSQGKKRVVYPNSLHSEMLGYLFDLAEDTMQQHNCVISSFKNVFVISRVSGDTLAFISALRAALPAASSKLTSEWTLKGDGKYWREDSHGTNDCFLSYVQHAKIPVVCTLEKDTLTLSSQNESVENVIQQFESEIG